MPLIQQSDPTLQFLHSVLDLRSQNQQVISSNIANADTPGFTPTELKFENILRDTLQGKTLKMVPTQPNHIALSGNYTGTLSPTIIKHPDQTGIGDENGVNVDQEMLKLSENQIMFEAAAQALRKKMSLLKYIVQDGR
jgi:flagellar basal-body rod protein FlgB